MWSEQTSLAAHHTAKVMTNTHQFTFTAVGIFTKFNKSASDFTSI